MNDIQLLHAPHPLLPSVDQSITTFKHCEGDTLLSVLQKCKLDLHRPLIVTVNGNHITRGFWDKTLLASSDFIVVKAAVEGGNGSNIWAVVAMIALTIATFGAFGWQGIGASLAGAGTFGAAAINMGVMLAGSFLINTLLPPPVPKGGSGPGTTYSISGGANQARQYQPLPVVLGRHQVTPDYGANPYVDFRGEDQFLYQVFNFGISDITLSDIKIGDTPIENYTECTVEESGPDGKLTLFPGNVDYSEVSVELHYNQPETRTTSPGTTAIGVDLQGILVNYQKDGDVEDDDYIGGQLVKEEAARCYFEISYRPHGSDGPWTSIVEDDATQPDNSFYGRMRVSIPGHPAGIAFVSETAQAQRRSIYRVVPEGQYDVRVTRLSQEPDPDDNRHKSQFNWTALRSYQPDTADYTGQKRLAVRIRASGQLNGRIDNLTAIASAKCPVWNGIAWVNQETSNPAWWFHWFAKGQYDANGRRTVGAGISDDRIGSSRLFAWADWCEAHNLSINTVLTSPMTCGDVLSLIARVGRATPSWGTGKLSVVWDAGDLPVTQLFTMANIKQGSFSIDYVSEKLADEIIVEFVNPELNWATDSVRALVPGTVNPVNSTKVDIPGITNKAQAGSEANLVAAAQYYHRRRVTWETDMEGLVCSKGSVVALSHDLTSWGTSGRLASGSTAEVLKLDRPVTFTALTQPYVSVRSPDGTIETKLVVAGDPEVPTDELLLDTPLSFDPSADEENAVIDYVFQFDPAATPGKRLKVIAIEPQGDRSESVRIIARDEDEGYYAAAGGDYSYFDPNSYGQGVPAIGGIAIAEERAGETSVRLLISWKNTAADAARLRIRDSAYNYTDYGLVPGQAYTIVVDDRQSTITVELTPVRTTDIASVKVGQAVNYTYTIGGSAGTTETLTTEMPRVSGLQLSGYAPNATEFTNRDAKFTWRKVAAGSSEIGSEPNGADSGTEDFYFKDYQITVLDESGATRRVEYVKDNSYTYSFERNLEDGSPVRTFTVEVRARGSQNQVSATPARLTVSNPPPAVPGGIIIQPGFKTCFINYLLPTDTDFVGVIAWVSPVSGFTPSAFNKFAESNTNNLALTGFETGTTYYVRIAGYDAFGTTDLEISDEYAITPIIVETGDIDEELTEAIEQNAADIAQEVLDRAAAITAEATARGTAIANEATIRQTEDEELATTISSVSAVADANTAAIATETTARVSGDNSLASSITALTSTVNTNYSTLTSSIASEASTRSSADTTLSNSITVLTSTVNTNNSTITASLATESSTRASADSALSSSITALTSTVGGHTSTLSVHGTSIDGINARYTVKIDNNGAISGYGLISEANNGSIVSSFQVLADNFGVYTSGGTVNPFYVSGSTVYMQNVVIGNAVIANAAITTAKIDELQITGRKVASGEITATALYDADLAGYHTTPGSYSNLSSVAVTLTSGYYSTQQALFIFSFMAQRDGGDDDNIAIRLRRSDGTIIGDFINIQIFSSKRLYSCQFVDPNVAANTTYTYTIQFYSIADGAPYWYDVTLSGLVMKK